MALEFLSPLHKASRQISVYLEGRTRELGLSPLEGHVLTYLRSYSPTSIRDLVRVFGIKQSTFTSLLDRLEAGGYARRTINPDDRRSFLVHITGKGAELAGRVTRLLQTLEDEIHGRVQGRDLKGFQAVMRAVDEITRVRLRER
jgi:DNA-binding MarR family transcriptional regulator